MTWFMDLGLSQRLERTEGTIGASFTVVPRAGVAAAWQDIDGTYAIFDGVGSPMTQSFGLGLFAPAATSLPAVEAFFAARGASAMHEVSPLAGVETFALLVERGYRPIELSTVLAQAIDGGVDQLGEAAHDPALRVRVIDDADRDAWIETSVAGWAADAALAPIIRSMAEAAAANRAMQHFVVERDGAPVGTGSLGLHEDVALLAGASTVPSARGLGAQALLLGARLAAARAHGCTIAMMVAAAGSTSQRNAERRGFRVAYTRTKWQLGGA